MLGTRSVRLFAALALAATSPGLGQNLFPHAEFDAGAQIGEWTLLHGTDHGIDNADSDLCSLSGSLFAVSAIYPEAEPDTHEVRVEGPCVPIGASTIYLSMRYYSADASFFATNTWVYSGSDCTDSLFIIEAGYPAPTGASWFSFQLPHTVGPTARSVRVHVVSSSPGSQPHNMRVDRIYVGHAPRVFADDFEGGEICRWAGSAPP